MLSHSILAYWVFECVASIMTIIWWRKLDRLGRLAGTWFIVAFLTQLIIDVVVARISNALIVTFLWMPLGMVIAMGVLAAAHSPGRSRNGLRIVAWLYVAIWAVLSATYEEPGAYPLITTTLHALILAGAGAYTVVGRVDNARTELWRDPPFLAASGFLLYAVPTVFLTIVGRVYMPDVNVVLPLEHYEPLLRYYLFRNMVILIAYWFLFAAISAARLTREAPRA